MKENDPMVILTFLGCLVSLASFIVAEMAYRSVNKLNTTQLNEISKANKPLLFIAHLNGYPAYINQKMIKDNWKIQDIFKKKQKAYIEYLDDDDKSTRLVEDEGTGQIEKNKRALILNLLTNEDDVKANICTTEIVLQNGGADLQSYQLDKVVIHYSSGQIKTLDGDKQAYQCYIEKGGTFNLWLTEITNNDQGTICDMGKITGEKSQYAPLEDILYMAVGKNFLNYNILEIQTTLTNIRGEKCSYNIIVEVKNGRVTTRTEPI
ncbi:hypothetical protein NE619_17040 [Anaerovorax odorimutans]|uniref:Uncharacterized protein n=1 Tax=Anaerovorax odorimutans TaxID=109327 RepID=A0ABT1RTJ1_9FIRM|nr:hypothetical protein [Anaerovorax odorimutans]MCQ4638439.1 hypothetical protein [Anaerovorax odorimutans]